jgi:hypothetical protein
LDSLIAKALESVRRQEPLSLELLERVGEVDPPQAAAALCQRGPLAEAHSSGCKLTPYGDEGDLRNGTGGSRQVQRFVQGLTETQACEEIELGHGNAYDALCWLGTRGPLGEARARVLRDAYGWLRRAEHFLQLADEAPLHHIPKDDIAQSALARRMGYREVDAAVARGRLMHDWQSIRTEVTAICA